MEKTFNLYELPTVAGIENKPDNVELRIGIKRYGKLLDRPI